MIKRIYFLLLMVYMPLGSVFAQLPPVFPKSRFSRVEDLTRRYIEPVRIVWQHGDIKNPQRLLRPGNGQADLSGHNLCVFTNHDSVKASIVLDFGKELQGGLQLVTDQSRGGKPVTVRLRFGESVSEAMSDVEPVKNATNDHAMRDYQVQLPWLGKLEIGNTGYRFVRIDLIGDNAELKLKEANAIFIYRDIPYLGSFKCSDTLLNKIWLTGAYTVHLNMQDYLWDGVKRDRLVWVGDLHPETSTISAVFGDNEVVEKSLDQARDITPLPNYMAGMISYSMWWIIIQRDWYMHTGNLAYLKQQQSYLKGLLDIYCTKVGPDGSEKLDGSGRFLDWPSSKDEKAIHAGLQGMLILTLQAGEELSAVLNDQQTAKKCAGAVAKLKTNVPDPGDSKQAAAMLRLAGLIPADKANKILSAGGIDHFSTFYGYYMLQAMAQSGDYQGAMDAIKNYWGPMLSLGATTFWEDFDVKWMKDAGRIDDPVPAGKVDVHSAYGDYCYKGFRLSLAHGWASGPTPFLTEYVLGVKVLAPGCRVIRIEPHLGSLTYAEGTFPTPYGVVSIKHTKLANGKVLSKVKAPKEVKVIVKA